MKNIGDTLKKLREKNGMTRKDATDKLKSLGIDISDKTLYGYESGRNSANADMFLALCKIYKCNNIMETFSETVEDILFTNNEWNIIEKYRSLDPHGQQTVDYILDREAERVKQLLDTQGQLRQSQERIIELESQASAIIPLKESPAPYTLNAAHTRTDIPDSERTPELAQLDDDIMKNF